MPGAEHSKIKQVEFWLPQQEKQYRKKPIAKSCSEQSVGQNFIDADHHICQYEIVIHDVLWVSTLGCAVACLGL